MRWFMAGLPGLVENVFELLGPSTHGQFYIDRAEAKVYYTPHPSEDMTKAVVSLARPSSNLRLSPAFLYCQKAAMQFF